MHRLSRAYAVLGACLGMLASSARAQNIDWSAFSIVHYVVVGEYSGEPSILSGGQIVRSHVTDRVELSFDWNQNETALVGTPTIKNFPGTMGPPIPGGPCPPVRPNGTYDHWTVTSATLLANTLQLTGTRSYAAAVVPHMDGMECKEGNVAASTEEATIMLAILPTVFFDMPAARGEGISISRDGKSIIFVDQPNGWTWTFTPTGVR